jgi:dTDP-3,4-didehydro-2,6-dideoxy-alpha-D-glucose 3-reductase
LVELAESKNRVLRENFMFKYHRQHQIVWENLHKGDLGSIRLFRSQFGFPPLDSSNFRYDNNLGGGSLLDAGAYTVMASRWFLGSDQDVISSVLYIDSAKNVDIYGNVTLQNKNGIVSQLSFGFDNFYQCNYEFLGSKGRIFVEKAFTPKPNDITKIIMETQDEKLTRNIKPDNHFVNILKAFHTSIVEHKQESHYKDILDQSRILSIIREKAIKIQL